MNLIFAGAKRVIISEVFHGVIPEESDVYWSVLVGPEGKGNEVIEVVAGISRGAEVCSYFVWRPPIADLIDIAKPDGIVDFPWLLLIHPI